jgi:hypothetical protein
MHMLQRTGRESCVGGDAAAWADAMRYIEEKFMPLMMRSPGHGGRSAVNYFPDIVVGSPKWFRVQLLLFKPHQGIYEGSQPLMRMHQSPSDACAVSGILCPACMCPTKKVFQHGCEGEACLTRKYVQILGMVTRGVLMAVMATYVVWVAVFSNEKFDSPWTVVETLSVFMLCLSLFRASVFLEIMVGDPLPHRDPGSTASWMRTKLILNSEDDRYVKPEHRGRHIGVQSATICAFAILFQTPSGIDENLAISICGLLWSFIVLQYFASV